MKRVPELRDLSDDHHAGLVLARRCRRAGTESASSPDRVWQQMIDEFSRHLEPHFQIEEKYLLPGLEAIGEASSAERIREDHRILRAFRDSENPSLASLERFGELLESHIRYEERQVFETTQHRLPARALRAIASACQAVPRVPRTPDETLSGV